jgi:hypothetical protein
MTFEATRPAADTLRMTLDQARVAPRVEAVSRSLRLDLSTESLWWRVRDQAEAIHQELTRGNSQPELTHDPATGPGGLRRRYVVDAMAAYAAVSRF